MNVNPNLSPAQFPYWEHPEHFTDPVTNHGFRHVDENAATLPDVHLGRLPAVTVPLDEVTVASQHHLHPGLVEEYTKQKPARKRILLRPYGDGIAVADGHHAVAAARARGEKTIRGRWIEDAY